MKRSVHASIPWLRLEEHIELFITRRVNPEVNLSAEALDNMDLTLLKGQAARLRQAGLTASVHAAFMDLNPGSVDSTIRNATRQRFEQVFRASELLQPRVIVFHPGYDDLRYGDYRQAWLDNSIAFWREMLPLAKGIGCRIAVENIFEKEPSILKELLTAIDDASFRHCFDVGHWNMFHTGTLEQWFDVMGGFVVESHIHDNFGLRDDHLPLGEAEIDFDLFFRLLKQQAPDAVWTIEAHTIARMERALVNIAKYF